MKITPRRLSRFSVLALLALFSARAWGQETADTKERDTGPRNLVITYRSTPAKRVAFRQYMLRKGLGRFEQWKKDGILQDYRILFNRYVDADTWDMMAVLFFPDYAHVDRWREVEIESPGGLTQEALSLTTPINTYSMDLIWHGDSSAKSSRGKTVFFVIPYDYYPHTIEEYMKYVNTYVIPQIDGWMRENIMATYRIFLNRYSTSRPWKSLFILEYRDAQSFGARERTMAKVRATLKDNPAWKSLSDTKQSMRVEKETVVADELLLP